MISQENHPHSGAVNINLEELILYWQGFEQHDPVKNTLMLYSTQFFLSVNFSWVKYSMVYSRPNIYFKMFHNLFILLKKSSKSYVFTYILANKILPLVLKYAGSKFNMCNYFWNLFDGHIYFFMIYLYFNFLYKEQSS